MVAAQADVGKEDSSYIEEMTAREPERMLTSVSVVVSRISGQMPKMSRHNVSSADGMMSPVRGIAIRFVRRK